MKGKIIICEDDKLLQNFYQIVLTKNNYEVFISEDGDEIISELLKSEPKLIIMDINLGNTYFKGEKTDGLKLSRYIKENFSFSHIPILISTASAPRDIHNDFLNDSLADELIHKPIVDFNSFLDTVNFLAS